jgi:hypothetical protein
MPVKEPNRAGKGRPLRTLAQEADAAQEREHYGRPGRQTKPSLSGGAE